MAQKLNTCVCFCLTKDTWTSHKIFTVICPSLHCDVLLGTPFLYHNKVVIDHGNLTTFTPTSSVNLLDKSPPLSQDLRAPIIPSLLNAQKSVAEERKQLNKELLSLQKMLRVERAPLLHELSNYFKATGMRARLDPFTVECDVPCMVAALCAHVSSLAKMEKLATLDTKVKAKFADQFPSELLHVTELPTMVYHQILMYPHSKISVSHHYSCTRKYQEAWKTLIDQHECAGQICPSSSEYASPSFIIPKADPTVLPRWVNNFHLINAATVPDNYLMSLISDILADCTKGHFWRKIDMMNSFQTLVHPDNIRFTVTLTPFGLWEWVVMPMGLRNSPATHQ